MPAEAATRLAAEVQAGALPLEKLLRQLVTETAPPTGGGQRVQSWTVACMHLFLNAVHCWAAEGQYSFFSDSVRAQLSPRITCEDRDHALAGVDAALRGLQRVLQRVAGGVLVPGTGLLEAIASMPFDTFNQLAPDELVAVRPLCQQLTKYCEQTCDAPKDGLQPSDGAELVAMRGSMARCAPHYAAATAELQAARELCEAAYAVVRTCRISPSPFEYTEQACDACLDRNLSQYLHRNAACWGY
jgi:hypothetical protein